MDWKALISGLIMEHELSVNGFASRCGINHTTILNILNEKTVEVQLKTKNKIERAFELTIDDTNPHDLLVSQGARKSLSIDTMVDQIIERHADIKGNINMGSVSSARFEINSIDTETIEYTDFPLDSCFWYSVDQESAHSMFPLLAINDKVMIDRNYTIGSIKDKDIVFLVYENRGFVRLFSRSNEDANNLLFYSINPSSPPLVLRKEKCKYFKVILINKI